MALETRTGGGGVDTNPDEVAAEEDELANDWLDEEGCMGGGLDLELVSTESTKLAAPGRPVAVAKLASES